MASVVGDARKKKDGEINSPLQEGVRWLRCGPWPGIRDRSEGKTGRGSRWFYLAWAWGAVGRTNNCRLACRSSENYSERSGFPREGVLLATCQRQSPMPSGVRVIGELQRAQRVSTRMSIARNLSKPQPNPNQNPNPKAKV